ncbi:MAG: MarR family transcriptional regulator [Pseudomonadota bacterium]
MHLSQASQDFILHWGEMGAKWGVNRSVAQIHALLHIAPDPMTADEICEALNLARSNVSTGLKELQAQRLVKSSRALGERKDRFTSVRDMFDLVKIIVQTRREQEFTPTLEALRTVAEEARGDDTPDRIQARIDETLETMEMFDLWYREMINLPRPVQMGLMKMGGRIARLLPKSKS